MQAFDFIHASSIGHAVALLQDGSDSRLLAGGQTLLAAMKLGLAAPARLIDLSRLPALQAVQAGVDGQCTVGAMASHALLARHPWLRQHLPGLADLAGGIADAQVRERGTIGGSAANADPSACWPAGLLALGAVLQTDRRRIAADDFFTGMFSTALAPDEILCSLLLPRPQRMAYVKFEQPASRFALVGVAVAQFGHSVRVALTGSASGVLRLPAFEAALGRRFEPAAVAGLAVEAALMSSDLHAGADYRAHLAAVAVRRAVLAALSRPALPAAARQRKCKPSKRPELRQPARYLK